MSALNVGQYYSFSQSSSLRPGQVIRTSDPSNDSENSHDRESLFQIGYVSPEGIPYGVQLQPIKSSIDGPVSPWTNHFEVVA
jgi:hypothetical protein